MALTPFHLFNMSLTITPQSVTVGTDYSWYATDGSTTTVPGTIQPVGASDALAEAGERARGTHVAFVAPSVTVLVEDFIVCNGVRYRVLGRGMDQAGRGVVQKLELERVEEIDL